jgi:hypothetical protein
MDGFDYYNATQVYPGGNTKCSEISTPYSFTVFKGSPHHVHLHFQGGGTAWDQLTYDSGQSRRFAKAYDENGAFDMNNPLNPYKNFTVIVILYCTGDFFLGNNAISNITNLDGQKVVFAGVANAMSVIRYVTSAQTDADGYLAGTLNIMNMFNTCNRRL